MKIEQVNLIYHGKREDFCWAGFGSGSGTNLRECAKVISPKLLFSDKADPPMFQLEELADIPRLNLGTTGIEYCGRWKDAQKTSKDKVEYKKLCETYDQLIVDGLKRFEEERGKSIDLIVLGGYMRIVQQPLIDAYPDRIINVHPGDLFELDSNNKRIYTGMFAVRDAIKAGNHTTRSSVIIVDGGIDHGEIITRGLEVQIWPEYYSLSPEEKKRYVELHQNLQKRVSDWPALTTALEMIANGRISLGTEKYFHNEWRRVYLDGNPLDYGGIK